MIDAVACIAVGCGSLHSAERALRALFSPPAWPVALQDLVLYRKFRNKEVASAARGLVGLFRRAPPPRKPLPIRSCPDLLGALSILGCMQHLVSLGGQNISKPV